MSWKIALVVAVLTALITAVVTAPVADKVTGMHGVSDFEGQRGFAVVFLFIPAGFIGGFLLGLLGTKLVHATEWTQFGKALGLSIVLGQVALWGIAGLSVLSIPRPPVVGGRGLVLEVEVRVPTAHLPPGWNVPDALRMSLYAGDRDNHYLTLDSADFHTDGDHLMVPARTVLNSSSARRVISFQLAQEEWLAFELPLPPTPDPDSMWSAPRPMRDGRDAHSTAHPSGVMLRYRVVRDGSQ